MPRRRDSRGLAWPPLVYLVVFFLVPTGLVVSYSFLTRDFDGGAIRAWSSEAWRDASSGATLKILGRSLLLATAVTLAAAAIGYPCALAAARASERARRWYVALIGFPLVTSLLLRVFGWMNLYSVVTTFLVRLSLLTERSAIEWRSRLVTTAAVMTVNYLPFMILPLLRARERIDPSLTHAALDLGATPRQAFWTVVWPLMLPGLFAGCALVFIPATGEYLVPHFLGEGKFDVLGTQIVKQFMERRNWPYASACAVWLLGLVAAPAVFASLRAKDPVDAAGGAHAR